MNEMKNQDNNKFTSLNILNRLSEIHNFLIIGNEKSAFFHMGIMTEWLAEMVRNEK